MSLRSCPSYVISISPAGKFIRCSKSKILGQSNGSVGGSQLYGGRCRAEVSAPRKAGQRDWESRGWTVSSRWLTSPQLRSMDATQLYFLIFGALTIIGGVIG